MKYDSYEQYYNSAVEYYKDRNELKIPIEYMILTKELFDSFNGHIDFGPGLKSSAKDGQCEGDKDTSCPNCDCKS